MRRQWVLVLVAIAAAALFALRGCPEDRDDGEESAEPGRDAATQPRTAETSRRARPAERREEPPSEVPPAEEPTTTVEGPAPTARLVVLVLRATDDAPVAEARVLVEGDESPAALTGADGRAVLVRRDPGFVALTVERPPGGAEFARRMRQLAQVPGETTVRLPGAVVLRGRVHAGGVRPRRVCVFCERSDVPPALRKIIEPTLGDDGSFAEEVAPGRYRVWTDPIGPAGTRWHHTSRNDVDPSREEVVFELREADGFSCTLVPEGVSGEGLLGCASASPSDGPIFFRDTPGKPAFGAPIHTLRVEAGVAHDVWAKVAKGRFDPAVAWGVARGVTPGSRVEIVVRPSWTLRVSLADPEGRPVRERLYFVARPERGDWNTLLQFGHVGETTAAGEATIPGLPPLPLTLHVGSPGQAWSAVEPPVVEAGTESIVVTVTKTHTLVGVLHDEQGLPVRAEVFATVPWAQPGVPEVGNSTYLPLGNFELRGLPPGPTKLRWSVGALDGGDLGEFVVPAPGPLRLTARLPR